MGDDSLYITLQLALFTTLLLCKHALIVLGRSSDYYILRYDEVIIICRLQIHIEMYLAGMLKAWYTIFSDIDVRLDQYCQEYIMYFWIHCVIPSNQLLGPSRIIWYNILYTESKMAMSSNRTTIRNKEEGSDLFYHINWMGK